MAVKAFGELFTRLTDRAGGYGVQVREGELRPETPAVFDGPTVTVDPTCEAGARCFYLAHALGSIAQWSTDATAARVVYDGLRDAKEARQEQPRRFEPALADYLAFEERSSELAVWLLTDLGRGWAVPDYTLFFRADLAAMEEFHRTGVAPVWNDFYPAFAASAGRGEVPVRPFAPRPVPPFRAVRIEQQEVVREEDGRPD